MGYDVTEAQSPLADARWWKTRRTASEVAEHLAGSIVDKENLERHLTEVVKENAMLKVRCSVATTELARERQRLQEEIADLKSKVAAAEKAFQNTGGGRLIAESAARERLLKDEFERIVQTLRVDLKMERQRFANQLKAMKDRMEGCMCGEFRLESASRLKSALPDRWAVRTAK